MRRVSLEETILQVLLLLAARTDDATGWTYASHSAGHFLQQCVQPPSEEAVQASIRRLRNARAVAGAAGSALTPLGAALARLPVDLRLGKLLLLGSLLGVPDEACSLAAVLSCKSPFLKGGAKSRAAAAPGDTAANGAAALRARRLRAFMPSDVPSDHLMLLNIHTEYARLKALDLADRSTAAVAGRDVAGLSFDRAWDFCRAFSLSRSVLDEVGALRQLFSSSLRSGGWLSCIPPPKSDAETTVLLVYSLAYGLAPNVARLGRVAWKGQEKGRAAPKGRNTAGNPGSMVFSDRDGVDLFVHPSTSFLGPTVSHLIQCKGKWNAAAKVELTRRRPPGTVRYGVCVAAGGRQALDGSDSYFMYHSRMHSSRTYLADCTYMPAAALLVFGSSSSSGSEDCDEAAMSAHERAGPGIAINSSRGAKGGGGSSCSVLVDGWLRVKASELHAVLFKRLAFEVEAALRTCVAGSSGRASDATAEEVGHKLRVVRAVLLLLFDASAAANASSST